MKKLFYACAVTTCIAIALEFISDRFIFISLPTYIGTWVVYLVIGIRLLAQDKLNSFGLFLIYCGISFYVFILSIMDPQSIDLWVNIMRSEVFVLMALLFFKEFFPSKNPHR